VLVANPRKLHAISRHERKCDRRDAQMLARLARVDPALLHPLSHGSAQAQHDLLGLKLRDALVRTRVTLINTVRFTLKSLGHAVRNPSSASFHKTILADVPVECLPVIQPVLSVLAQLTTEIKALEHDLVQRSKKDYPVTQRLQQIAGVGPLTALGFVLKIGDPQRFGRSRDVGAYLGLCPRRDQSGGTDKQLRISKCGDGLLRRLLVSAAHYILGPFGPTAPCANTASASPAAAAPAKRNAPSSPSPANSPCCCSPSGNTARLTNPAPPRGPPWWWPRPEPKKPRPF
jgi:transposase